jgi:hypothetical protein
MTHDRPAMKERPAIELSLILALHESESRLAAATANARRLGHEICESSEDSPPRWEILACDQHSHDNTLSALSLLQGKIPELRTIPEIDRGRAIARGARLARGRWWLFSEDGLDFDLAHWAIESLRHGCAFALAPSRVLAVTAELGQRALLTHRGGLVSAQRRCQEVARKSGLLGAFAQTGQESLVERLKWRVRSRLTRVGLVGLDRRRS